MNYPVMLKSKYVSEAVTEIASALKSFPLSYGHGLECALDEAAYLVSFVAEIPPDFSEHYNRKLLDERAIERLQSFLYKRIHLRIPMAYLLGETWQMGVPFLVNQHVLIPRSPIAQMISERFSPWLSASQQVGRILDLCTGSGCLGILAALEFTAARVDVTDIDSNALDVAVKNIARHGLNGRINAIISDVYRHLPTHQYDIIIANPPYVPQAEQTDLPREFSYEPGHALFAGEDGLDIARRIIRGASRYLEPRGILVLEVGHSAAALEQCFPEYQFVWQELPDGGEGVCILTGDECSLIAEQMN